LYFFATILTQLQREADPPERELLALLFGDFAPTTSNFCHCASVSEYFVAARERGKKTNGWTDRPMNVGTLFRFCRNKT
jgi:hypothetical protein